MRCRCAGVSGVSGGAAASCSTQQLLWQHVTSTLEVVCFLIVSQKPSSPHDKYICAGSDMEVELVEEDQAAAWEEVTASSALPAASAVALRRATGGRNREEWMATIVQVSKEPWWAAVGNSTRHGQLHHERQACSEGRSWRLRGQWSWQVGWKRI